jgi:hypothetical protein
MSPSKLHKIYAAALVALLVVAVIVATQWADHVRDEAKRDGVIEAQKSEIGDIEKRIADTKQQAAERIAALEQQKQKVTPAQAPLIIRELIPGIGLTPEQRANQPQPPTPQRGSAAAAGEQKLPDAPEPQNGKPLTLSPEDQVYLAQFGLGCKQCDFERAQLQAEAADLHEVIDRQKIELGAAMKAAKGGSVWQRTTRVLKWALPIGGIAYVIGRTQH